MKRDPLPLAPIEFGVPLRGSVLTVRIYRDRTGMERWYFVEDEALCKEITQPECEAIETLALEVVENRFRQWNNALRAKRVRSVPVSRSDVA